MQTQVSTQNEVKQEAKPFKPDFGSGRYASYMLEWYKQAMLIFHLSPEKAAQLAKNIATDVGAVISRQEVQAIRLGKPTKDQTIAIAEVTRAKGVEMTNPITALKAMQWVGEAFKNGISYQATGWKPVESLEDYFNTRL